MLLNWQVYRGVAWLKRLALATERSADAMETLARIEQDRWEHQFAPRPKGKFVAGVMDQAAANERWRKMNEADDGA